MEDTGTAIERFFRAFELNNTSSNITASVSQFADVFMVAGPQGVQAVRSGDFALALPKRKQLFDKLGCRSTALVSLRETRLDARYMMATTQWRMTFLRDQGEPEQVLVDSVYIVDTGSDALKIVFYLASQDIMEVLRNRGILPGQGS